MASTPMKSRLLFALCLVLLLGILGACTPDLDHLRRAQNTPSQVTSSPEPKSQVTVVPSHPENPLTTQIFIVDKNVSSRWHVKEAVLSWQPAKYTEISFVKECPADWNIACVTISEVNNLSLDYAGSTTFNNVPRHMAIALNKRVDWISDAERETTVCHELGHVLGMPHIRNRKDTCMYDGDYYGKYPLRATAVDLSLVDRYGEWDLDKMYVSSGKTIAYGQQPR